MNTFKRFSKLMDMVLPDPMANPYKEDLERLSDIYGRAKECYRDESMNLEGCGQKVRELIYKHIRSSGIEILNDDPVSVMDEEEFQTRLDTLESDEAKASEMRHAVKHEISVRYDEDPVHYKSLQERVEELIENYRQKRLSDKELLEELRDVLDEIRSRKQMARAKGLDDSTELSFYHAIGEVLREGGHDEPQETLVDLTTDIVSEVEKSVDIVEWKQKMQKGIELQLYRSDVTLSDKERDELTNRIIELARRHYR